jgi:hypothetical protein
MCIPSLGLGCAAQVGLVVLDTKPPQATVYLDDTRVGETPVAFHLDRRQSVTLKILKDGYIPKTEVLGAGWVERETRDGHYTEGDYVIHGILRAGFEIHTQRELREDPKARRQRRLEERNLRKTRQQESKRRQLESDCLQRQEAEPTVDCSRFQRPEAAPAE